ncbi:MAG: penicillin-binding transpeptidase domain-containing protein [Chitinivibrionia bacterium]|jgi:cell division protein FtsI/penicillin-binding protein 2|nr:penicillin-binding transpeptidase domain-containing protein [Chitinivibrionia bacterium]
MKYKSKYRSKKVKKINIPLSKILKKGAPILIIAFVVGYYISTCGKKTEQTPQESEKTAETAKERPAAAQRNARFTANDLKKLMEQFPPNLTQDRDTVRWQRTEVIRYFSIDTTLQRRAQNQLNRARGRYAAVVAINPETGQIISMVSHRDPELPEIAPNMALSSRFLAASIIKTVTAQAAFENMDITTASTFRFPGRGTTLYRAQFTPLEFGERANETTFAQAYARSTNPVFGWMALHHIGRSTLHNTAERFGWNSPIPFEMPVDISYFPETTPDNINNADSLAFLGSGFHRGTTLSPILGALMMASILNQGVMMAPTLVDSVVDMQGRRLYKANTRKWRQTTANDIADSLLVLKRATTSSGSARRTFREERRTFLSGTAGQNVVSGGKTGTLTNDLGRNEWFVGFAKDTTRNITIATSVVLVQPTTWHLRPSQISANIMYEHVRRRQRVLAQEVRTQAEAQREEAVQRAVDDDGYEE